jgi:hypothetical protein
MVQIPILRIGHRQDLRVVFEGGRLRIEWATSHGKVLAEAWNSVEPEELYTVGGPT